MKSINIYNCGPTLFDYVHIGCYRIFVLADVIDKHFKNKGFEVKHGMNVMDIDDKILEYQKDEKFSTEIYYKSIKEEYKYLNINYPNYETITSKNIDDYEKVIDRLLNGDVAYIKDSGIYLSLKRIDNYGEITNINIKKEKNMVNLDKDNGCDPALWKFKKEAFGVKYKGKVGRPGWDIQCATNCVIGMNGKIDYQFCGFNDVTHYENNKVIIEKSSYKYPSKWILVRFINFVDDTPYYYLKDYIKNGYCRQVLRYALYSIKYSTAFDFSQNHLFTSKKDVDKLNELYKIVVQLNDFQDNERLDYILKEFKSIDSMIEDLKIPQILGLLFKIYNIYKKEKVGKSQNEKTKKILDYLNKRLDFLY